MESDERLPSNWQNVVVMLPLQVCAYLCTNVNGFLSEKFLVDVDLEGALDTVEELYLLGVKAFAYEVKHFSFVCQQTRNP